MRILYHVPDPNSTGADRWIYEGWKHAFLDLGHQFFELTEGDELEEKIRKTKPDIFWTAINKISVSEGKKILRKIRAQGIKVFFMVDWPIKEEEIRTIRTEEVADIFFGEREPESMAEFISTTGRAYHLIPNAADRFYHFPVDPVKKYQYDIVYLGAYLPKKKQFFEEVLFPLAKRYKVGIFGPYWTVKDNFLRVSQRIVRALKLKRCAGFLNRLRVVIPSEEENLLYSSARIALNFHEREKDGSQPHHILNQRTFKIPACGGFEICDEVPALRKYFTEDEMVTAADKNDWFSKIDYYLTHEENRKKIQEAGTRRALTDHTYHNRVAQVMELYQKIT